GSSALTSIFDVAGKMDCFFRAYVEVLYGLWRKDWELGRGTIFEFTVPFKRVPVLATAQGKGLTDLLINIGDNAANRLQGNIVDGNETFTISGNHSKVDVTFQDTIQNRTFTQSFYGITRVIGFAGKGNDNVDLSGLDDSVDVEFHGGDGNDTIKGGKGRNLLYGDEGDDLLEGSDTNPVITFDGSLATVVNTADDKGN